jgi:DNA-binding XRE family transcriptional regulator
MSSHLDPSTPPDGAFEEPFWAAVRRRAHQLRAVGRPAPRSRSCTADGETVQVRFHDRQQLVALRTGRPDDEGRPGRTLTQRQVAARIDISHGHYGDLESGRRHPSLAVAQRLATFFEVPLEALCDVVPVDPAAPVRAGGGGPEPRAAETAGSGRRR